MYNGGCDVKSGKRCLYYYCVCYTLLVMYSWYYIYGISGPSLLIESTDSMIIGAWPVAIVEWYGWEGLGGWDMGCQWLAGLVSRICL